MFTTRLSSVITGWLSNETTCSRRSICVFTRSTNGTMKFRPGSRVLRYRPNRSTFRARACGMIRTERTTVSRTMRATTAAMMISAMTMGLLPWVDERRRAFDLHDVDGLTDGDDQRLVVCTSRPLFAADPDPAAVAVDLFEYPGGPANQS